MAITPQTLLTSAALVGAYGGLCWTMWRRHRRLHGAKPAAPGQTLLLHASQTGLALDLAQQSAAALQAAGLPVQLLSLGELSIECLRQARQALFLVSTAGEGAAPDLASAFVRGPMQTQPDLAGLSYGLLALGDRSYADFCAFGRRLDGWLQGCGANALFERIEMDRGAPAALAAWRERLGDLGADAAPAFEQPLWQDWVLQERELLNPGSLGAPLYRLRFVPPQGRALPDWQAGDLVQVQAPGEPSALRDYSIASLPSCGGLELLVRRQLRADGSPGLCSGWLCERLRPGEGLRMRCREHPSFRLSEEDAERPLILIGSGSGLAGLRAHLRSRDRQGACAGRKAWLIYGERQSEVDRPCFDELAAWQDSGLLHHLDLVYSRDPVAEQVPRYVQQQLLAQGQRLRDWVAGGAAVLICGSLQGMAEGVDRALRELLGDEGVEQLLGSGRLRRDVY
ncbi:sulfite reductase (NADPH) flavoprotein alpha-component [Paucibacter oligotrophus]|uniref:NADPH--hemoprotein reductase n=1 Tax=Roseateles oligotrophus TaxID=1769250 RepID=A0A840LCK8_9BURK|nr:sulfite reductase subunit alpha [Roseateles oligotrophus]MBB4844645.1 sulfite reductase (NADPH) flavoprotein alpha-component [Roseateles oligotrophus]